VPVREKHLAGHDRLDANMWRTTITNALTKDWTGR
jgi:hypothetical protein